MQSNSLCKFIQCLFLLKDVEMTLNIVNKQLAEMQDTLGVTGTKLFKFYVVNAN